MDEKLKTRKSLKDIYFLFLVCFSFAPLNECSYSGALGRESCFRRQRIERPSQTTRQKATDRGRRSNKER